MATYVYDDFRVTFRSRIDGSYDVVAVGSTGVETTGEFRVPLSSGVLGGIVQRLSRTATRRASQPTRDLRPAGPAVRDAEVLGGALADALFSGAVGASYDADRLRAERAGHGLRLSLSLADAPALLSVPWEFMYRRPRFMASQRDTPVVRLLDIGSAVPPPTVASVVRILGVIANPRSLPPLDVDAERRRVEQTLARVTEFGRVELDWLEPATPRRLREALRDGSYHVLHYIGHSDFTDDGEGMLFLEDIDGTAAEVNSTVLANLLDDQDDLRLVVLNSCEGARTSLTDPYAGVATTLIQLGVPAVVAMQFPISDAAAITFGEELYTNLIARQDPIDAAVAEGRKAIYVEIDRVEWATPVLFVRDPDVELLRFALPPAPLPPPGEPVGDGSARRRRRRVLAVAVAATVALGVAATVAVFLRSRGAGDGLGATGDGSVGLAVQVEQPDRRQRLLIADADLGNAAAAISVGDGDEIEPDWNPHDERLAFRRVAGEGGCQLCAVSADASYVTLVPPPQPGRIQHAPTWQAKGGDGLFYAITNDCTPGRRCRGEIEYVSSADGVTSPELVATGLSGIRDLDADPWEANRLLLVDDSGASLLFDHDLEHLAESDGTATASFTADGNRIVGIATGDTLRIWDRQGTLIAEPTIPELLSARTRDSGGIAGLEIDDAKAVSVSSWTDPSSGPHTDAVILLNAENNATVPAVAVVRVDLESAEVSVLALQAVPFQITKGNEVRAVAQ